MSLQLRVVNMAKKESEGRYSDILRTVVIIRGIAKTFGPYFGIKEPKSFDELVDLVEKTKKAFGMLPEPVYLLTDLPKRNDEWASATVSYLVDLNFWRTPDGNVEVGSFYGTVKAPKKKGEIKPYAAVFVNDKPIIIAKIDGKAVKVIEGKPKRILFTNVTKGRDGKYAEIWIVPQKAGEVPIVAMPGKAFKRVKYDEKEIHDAIIWLAKVVNKELATQIEKVWDKKAERNKIITNLLDIIKKKLDLTKLV